MELQIGRTLDRVLQQHIDAMSHSISDIEEGKDTLILHTHDETTLIAIAELAQKQFEQEPALLTLAPPITVVGDLHGQLLDLYRIFTRFGLPPATRYLFLGDIVDRGSFSMETVTLVFLLKVMYPEHIYVLRGNHEFRATSMFGGFLDEINSVYMRGTAVFDAFVACFAHIPLVAKIDTIICLHAGLSPDFVSLQQVADLQKPIEESEAPLLSGILWSDPTEDETTSFASSRRGAGFYFGLSAFQSFMSANGLTTMIRGHQCTDGVNTTFGGACITVFSASNYCGSVQNRAGVVVIKEQNKIKPIVLRQLRFLERGEAVFVNMRKRIMIGNRVRANTNQVIKKAPDLRWSNEQYQKLANSGAQAIEARARMLPPVIKAVRERRASGVIRAGSVRQLRSALH